MNEKEIIREWVRRGGFAAVAAEECGELIQAVTKIMRYGDGEKRREHLAEEMADCGICIDALCEGYGIKADTNDVDLAGAAEKHPAEYLVGALGDVISDVGIIMLREAEGKSGCISSKQMSVTVSNALYGIIRLKTALSIADDDISAWRAAKLRRLVKRMTEVSE